MPSTNDPIRQVRGPADLLTAVPYLLGFHPHESLVIIGLNDKRVIVTARLDLTDLPDALDVTDSRVLADTMAAIERGEATAIVGAVFTDDATPNDAVARQLADQARTAGLDLLDTLRVTHGRWRSLSCPDTSCCPPEGTPMPATPSVLDAAATYAGLTALPSRDALAAIFTPLTHPRDLAVQLEDHHHNQLSAVGTDRLGHNLAMLDVKLTGAAFADELAPADDMCGHHRAPTLHHRAVRGPM